MGNNKTIGTVLLVVGIIVLIVSVGADVIGLGTDVRFGIRQILGTVVGIILMAAGFIYYRR